MNPSETEKKNIHYWWFEYLIRHEGYKECCKAGGKGKYELLYEDFGNVHNVDFKDWWPEHEHLFEQAEPYTLSVITSFDQLFSPGLSDENNLLIELNLTAKQDELLSAFKTILKDHHKGRKGRPQQPPDTTEYPLSSWMDARSCMTALEVYDRVKADPNEKPDLSAIGEELKKAKKLNTGSDGKKGLYDEVLRQYRLAERLINNVATDIPFKLSRFPLDE